MRIAYLILAHNNIAQLGMLIDMLSYNTQHYCFIHLDARLHISSVSKKLKRLTKSNNWHMIKKREPISWGGFSMVGATLNLILEALNHESEFDYLSLHSGMDLPIKSNDTIIDYLAWQRGKQFIDYYEIPNYNNWADNGALDRIDYYWFIEEVGRLEALKLFKAQKLASLKRELPNGIEKIYGGSQWWTLTADCAEYIIHFLNDTPTLIHFFKYTNIPDEMFFQTILLNSEHKEQIVNNNLRVIDWKTGPEYPRIFDISDLGKLETSNRLFARKFDDNIDLDIITHFKKIL